MRRLALLCAGLLLLISCAGGNDVQTSTIDTESPSGSSTTSVEADWLTPAEEYLAAYQEALNAHDPIGAAAFHVPGSMLMTPTRGFWGYRRTGIELALRVAYANDPEFFFTSSTVFVGSNGAVVVGVDHMPSPVAGILGIYNEGIAFHINAPELAYEDARFDEWVTPIQEPNTRAALADARAVYGDWRTAWNEHDETAILDLFADEVRDQVAPTIADILENNPDLQLEPSNLSEVIPGASNEPALFFAGSPGDRREVSVVGIYSLTTGECPYTVATTWALDRGRVAGSDLLFEVESLRRCGAPDSLGLPDEWWWPSLTPPEPAPLVLTDRVGLPSGHEIEILNGTERLTQLVEWALGRYGAAGLIVPEPNSVAFPPSPRCRGVSGLAVDTGEGLEVQMCYGEEELCADDSDCSAPSVVARLNLLHELAHVWLTTQLDETRHHEFLDLRGLDTWWGPDLAWVEMGVEHAAEIIAWGLMDEIVPLPRLPDTSCDTLVEGFRLLTGQDPIVDTATCTSLAESG
jgi:hypothetical protein